MFGAAGLLAGAAGRGLLARLRRGARVRAGPCELACGVLFALAAARWTAGGLPGWWLPVPLVLTALAVPLAAADLMHSRLPDALTLPAYGLIGGSLGVAALVTNDGDLPVAAALGCLVFGVAHLVVHVLAPSSLGAGDVKLAGSLGGVLGALGWPALLVAALLASLLTLLLSLGSRLKRAAAWRSGVPHGPALLLATWLVAVFPGAGATVGLPG